MKKFYWIMILVLCLVVAGCQSSPQSSGDVVSECFWSGTVEAWEDVNGDGVRDPDERPLNGIRVQTLYTGGEEPVMRDEFRTEADGTAKVGAISTSCDWENYQVTLVIPAGYEISTDMLVSFADVNEERVILFGLMPDTTPTPEPSATATEAPTDIPTLTAVPTEATTPTEGAAETGTPYPDAGFSECAAMTREQAEEILGPLDGDPFPLEWIGSSARRSGICVFPGELNTASVQIEWYNTEAGARGRYNDFSGGEVITGIGDAAQWSESNLALTVLRGHVVFSVQMTFAENARGQAIRVGQLGVIRIP